MGGIDTILAEIDRIREAMRSEAGKIASQLSRKYNLSRREEDEVRSGIEAEIENIIIKIIGRVGPSDTSLSHPLDPVKEAFSKITEKIFDFFPYILALLIIFFDYAAIIAHGDVSGTSTVLTSVVSVLVFLLYETLVKKAKLGIVRMIQVILSGILVGMGGAVLRTSLGLGTGGGAVFFIIYLGFMLLIYSSSGFGGIVSVSILIAVIGYIFAGPYGGITRHYVSQIKEPIGIGISAVREGISNVWLMMTNPTEWYNIQQQRNVHPEKAISYPKGVEIISAKPTTPSVPRDQTIPVRIYTQIKNEGDMTARNLTVKASCEQYCQVDPSVKEPQTEKTYEKFIPGYADIALLGPFVPSDDARERHFMKLKIYAEYRYSTNTSLDIRVVDRNELERMFQENNYFKTTVSIGKPSPAMLSLNVGPQPLIAGSKMGLLVSVLNTRNNGEIYLDENTVFRIKIPSELRAGDFDCSASYLTCNRLDDETQECRIAKDVLDEGIVTIKPKRKNTIFSFFCPFEVTENVNRSITRLASAQLIDYIYSAQQTVSNIKITYPLGIGSKKEDLGEKISKSEGNCAKCGKGWFKDCDRDECDELSNCYFVVEKIGGNCRRCTSETSCKDYEPNSWAADKIGKDESKTCEDDPCNLNDCVWRSHTWKGECLSCSKDIKSCSGYEKDECEADPCGFNCTLKNDKCIPMGTSEPHPGGCKIENAYGHDPGHIEHETEFSFDVNCESKISKITVTAKKFSDCTKDEEIHTETISPATTSSFSYNNFCDNAKEFNIKIETTSGDINFCATCPGDPDNCYYSVTPYACGQ